MVMCLEGLGSEKDFAGEAQQQLKTTDPDLSSERAPHINKPCNCLKNYIKKGEK
jgi:hypothetical protein